MMICVPAGMRDRIETRDIRTGICGYGTLKVKKNQKAYVVDKSTCLGIGEHGQSKGSNLEMCDGILHLWIGYM